MLSRTEITSSSFSRRFFVVPTNSAPPTILGKECFISLLQTDHDHDLLWPILTTFGARCVYHSSGSGKRKVQFGEGFHDDKRHGPAVVLLPLRLTPHARNA